MGKKTWTDASLKKALSDAKREGKTIWTSDPGAERGKGVLQLRAMPDGKGRWYYRYSLPGGKTERIPLGTYGFGVDELTLAGARLARDAKAAIHQKSRDVRAFEAETEQAQREAKAQAARDKLARQEEIQSRARLSVDRLFAEYVAHLGAAGKAMSSRDAANMFKNHFAAPFPALAALPAAELTPAHVVEVLRRLIAENKKTTARKLRSYLRAAYALAVGAGHDPNTKAQLDRFGIKTNPVHLVKTIKGGSVAGDRALTEPELRAYVQWLDDHPSVNADALTLALYVAGQRMSQLARIRVLDVDVAEQTMAMSDPKGRRSTPRRHVVPYGTRARQIIEKLLAECKESGREFLFVDAEAQAASRVSAASKIANMAAVEIAADPARYGLTKLAPFRMGDLRRTCETMLAPMVSKDIRAQLLSHGVSGVQATNYDKHDYLDEKRAAINAWESRLADIVAGRFKSAPVPASKVTALPRAKVKRG